MKKTVKKLTAVGLTLTSVMSLAACGNSSSSNGNSTSKKEVTKPDLFTVMADGTVVTETNGGQAFYDYLASLTGLSIKWIRPDHSAYYQSVANVFNSEDTMPDVCILSADYYSQYAANGFLWNCTDAYNNSELKSSGRLISTAQNVLDALVVPGADGSKGMYGLSTFRGNGCVTYVKAAWVTAAGIDRSKMENTTMDFNTYYGYLKQMQANKGHYVISAPGFIATEAPYTNYLPEFYQQAQYTFYKNSSGQYVDGFSEQAMQDALQRIQTGVKDGVIDKESVNNTTSNCRDKFYSTNPSSESGVFSYWAGKWDLTLTTQLKAKGLDSDLIEIKPIKELGTYVERIAPAWCITTHAQNPEGIFKYFLESMLDGGDVQTAWEYGAKGTHWDTKAETVTLAGKDTGTTYTEGQFHILPSVDTPNTLNPGNNIDPLLKLATFQKTDSNPKGDDPGQATIDPIASTSEDFFANNSSVVAPVPRTEEMSNDITDINTTRNYVISQVALGYMSPSDGMSYYKTTVGSLSDAVVKSLNKAK